MTGATEAPNENVHFCSSRKVFGTCTNRGVCDSAIFSIEWLIMRITCIACKHQNCHHKCLLPASMGTESLMVLSPQPVQLCLPA
jgi:Fe-S-cluster-containing dehydrogenase component